MSPDGLSAPSGPYGVPLVTVELERINAPLLPAVSPGGAPQGGSAPPCLLGYSAVKGTPRDTHLPNFPLLAQVLDFL